MTSSKDMNKNDHQSDAMTVTVKALHDVLGPGHVKPRSCHITAVNNVPGRAPRAARAETRVAGPGTQHSHGGARVWRYSHEGHVCDVTTVMGGTCVTS